MRTFRDAKAMARALRAEVLDRHQVDLSHSTAQRTRVSHGEPWWAMAAGTTGPRRRADRAFRHSGSPWRRPPQLVRQDTAGRIEV